MLYIGIKFVICVIVMFLKNLFQDVLYQIKMLVMLINLIVKMVIWKNRFIYLRIYIVNYVILFMYVVKGIFVRWI